ncbi:tRNA (N6-threonylcarbamoyladenosine(37)-N6)-methyltransferase TrmO [Xenorhabdus sp. 42]|uniref:tRNA (N6-threonylcarbamoyladenosine(37)-N6)-methyltransferase TrmO n=1 Tax=Xenorhabdus szentirmaii TaxID=290112 RepID=A0AAW3YRQ2_9GAMM|nr:MULTISPECIES: tRNA (N6-threonylcarbamoyladenosine(37)-N6)-methyltransferase TrmO [unclassified Xenorhabdus]MBD2782339.1 tRNA (N6-threonylcarbamoyladenosine(37)-N6)-methyltransferase TrmO [Xenorhabdus sp. 38]MBD2793621.1 tRNA (N6-threonylcarbamoyladenosine(37)-N6)-methyltransferase TrmO [Xenorhabdus sp. CUL]MBD2799656.1 tRNA (N6-threonylcarbamoyladenosine(37)-N6)-methyltransferase TrmO [Xenorhabdus sp. M]MBD2803625.1 tRNA (N6-threonylcarbamoyladenosine(37)-N6)-methyltransferase TrmO [Xenorhab
MADFHFTQIGTIHSPYKEKFAIPRQPGLVEDGIGQLELLAPYNQVDAVRGLEQFSHLWIIFVFHKTMDGGWNPLVRPPRLGGNAKMGVFATRSTFRPNPIGMSLVELKGIQCKNNRVILELGSLDLLHGTPVIDIKPYLPFAEAHPEAKAGFAQSAPDNNMAVNFSPEAENQLLSYLGSYPHLKRFISQILAQDPRPAYRKKEQENRIYAAHILDFNVRWLVCGSLTEVVSIELR